MLSHAPTNPTCRKGAKFFPGTITAIAPAAGGGSATCSILYDDGDKEDGAVGANIRRLGPAAAKASEPESTKDTKPVATASSAAAEPRAKDANGLTLVVGDKVEAKYKGKGALFF